MCVIKVKTPWEKIRQINFHVDLFCVYPVKNKYRWVNSNALKHVDRKYYDTLSTIEWAGRTINIPNHAEEYLSLRYGNWKFRSKIMKLDCTTVPLPKKDFD